jgi:serine/threonine-protein kinase
MKKCPKCGRTFEDANTLCPSDGAVLAKTKDALVGRTLADKYRVDEKISEGGMGTVYRGTHVLMEKAVAIKVLHPSLAADDKIVARFTREARAASRISHPHALNVTDFGEAEDGIVFLVMEYLRGATLKHFVRANGPMALDRVVTITSQIAGALDAAHAEGVVHRDLKSDNIMLCETGGTGGDWAKVLDFGIAKIKEPIDGDDPELTAPNLIIGTPQYMSPEQCSQASDIDFRSDIYSFGVIIFEMLAGHVPFTGESATAVMLKHLQEPAPSVLEERDDLPAAVGRVVARALSKRPEDRQQSAGELAEQLSLAAEGAPAAAATGENRAAAVRDTNRIVVSTGPHEGRDTASEALDESTVVRASAGQTPTAEHEYFADVIEPPPAASFNPWKVIVPAAVLVVALLGVFYAVTRNSSPAVDNSNAPLSVDPNASPAQTASPPTGAAESGVVPASTTAPSPGASVNVPAGGDTAGAFPQVPAPSSDPNATPAVVEEAGANRNANKRQGEKDDEEEGTDPTPPPTPKPTQQRSSPTPAPSPSREGDDPPPPSPKKSPPSGTQSQPAAPASDPPPPSA